MIIVERVYRNRHGAEKVQISIGATLYTFDADEAELLARDIITALRIFRTTPVAGDGAGAQTGDGETRAAPER